MTRADKNPSGPLGSAGPRLPEPRASADSARSVRVPPTTQFRSLDKGAPAGLKQGLPLVNPVSMSSRVEPRRDFHARQHKLSVPVSGSPVAQSKLGVPRAAPGRQHHSTQREAQREAQRAAPREIGPLREQTAPRKQHPHDPQPRQRPPEPAATSQSTPPRKKARVEPSARGSGRSPFVELHCLINNKKSTVHYTRGADSFYVANKRFPWSYISIDSQPTDTSGNTFTVSVISRDTARISFILSCENNSIFVAECTKHSTKLTRGHAPPQSLKRHGAAPLNSAPHKPVVDESTPTLSVTASYSGTTVETTMTLNSRGIYINKLMLKRFEWPGLPVERKDTSPLCSYILHGDHELQLQIDPDCAARFEEWARLHGARMLNDRPTPHSSPGGPRDTTPRKELKAEPKAESSPRTSRESNALITSPMDGTDGKKASRLKYIPTPSARPVQALDRSKESSPQSFYGPSIISPPARRREGALQSRPATLEAPEAAAEAAPEAASEANPARAPANADLAAIGDSRKDPIDLASSPEKPGRRRTRRTRASMDVPDDDPVEPTSEDFALLRNDGFRRVAYRFWDGRLMEVAVEDIARLNPRIYVNDTIIWFFLRLFLERLHVEKNPLFDKILLLNTFFYPEVRKGESPKWVTKLPILSKHITIMPIHEAAHWSVAVIVGLDKIMNENDNGNKNGNDNGNDNDNDNGNDEDSASGVRPAIVVLDSLGSSHNHHTFRKVVSVLRSVLKMHNKPQLTTRDYRSLRTSVPVQTNLTDCGVYLLHYVEQIFQRPDKFLNQVQTAQDRTLNMGEFWREAELPTKRDDLKHTLKRLGNESSADPSKSESFDDDDIEVVGMEEVRRKRQKATRSLPQSPSATGSSQGKAASDGPESSSPANNGEETAKEAIREHSAPANGSVSKSPADSENIEQHEHPVDSSKSTVPLALETGTLGIRPSEPAQESGTGDDAVLSHTPSESDEFSTRTPDAQPKPPETQFVDFKTSESQKAAEAAQAGDLTESRERIEDLTSPVEELVLTDSPGVDVPLVKARLPLPR